MNCPNCNAKNSDIFHDKVWSITNGKVYQCDNCELIYIDPMMNEQEEKIFYKNYNSHVKNRGMTVANSIVEFHEKSKVIAKERFNIVEKYFKNNKILEVGSSTGAFLSLLENTKRYACELSNDNQEYSKQFINGKAYSSLAEVDENEFDVICMFHVFEHIRKPIEFLNNCKKLLSKKGIILIEVPSSTDPLITLYNCKEFKDFVFQPMHPMVYNEKSLEYVFKKSGFIKKEIIFYQRYGLSNHMAWFKNKKAGGDIELQEILEPNSEYKNKLVDIKMTDTIFYIASIA